MTFHHHNSNKLNVSNISAAEIVALLMWLRLKLDPGARGAAWLSSLKRAGKQNFWRAVPAPLHKLGFQLVDASQALRDAPRAPTSQNSVAEFWLD